MKITPNWRREKAPIVIAEPWRFGLLFGPEPVKGDIDRTYSCDCLPKLRGAFEHEGRQYASMGGSCCCYGSDAHCYELLPFDPKITLNRQRYCYNDAAVTFRGGKFILCRPIIFRSRPLTVEEWRWELRQMFAHGGTFARIHDGKKGAYHVFLAEWCGYEHRTPPVEMLAAAKLELADPKLPKTRNAMHKLCLTDPLYTTLRPWDKWAAAKRETPVRMKLALSADDLLSEALRL